MRYFLFTLLLTFTVCICSAQTGHMKFKGVPMEGTLMTFTNKLKAKGLTPIGIQNGVSLLKGNFAGYKNCTVYAIPDNNGMICKVSVIFPSMDKWGDLEQCYSNYKYMLSEKYGKPKTCVEYFQSDLADNDFYKFHEIKMDNCKYYSIFNCENGKIRLEITHYKLSDCYVMLSYFDDANQERLRKQIMDDL